MEEWKVSKKPPRGSGPAGRWVDWTTAYRPATIKEIAHNQKPAARVLAWLLAHGTREKGLKRALMVAGPNGTGKTTAVGLALETAGYEEVDLGLERGEAKFGDNLREAMQMANVAAAFAGKPSARAVVINDVDSLQPASLAHLVRAVNPLKGKTSITKAAREGAERYWTLPVIVTTSVPHASKLSDLRRVCQEVRFGPVPPAAMAPLARRVRDREGLAFSDEEIDKLMEATTGDVAAMLALLRTAEAFFLGKSTSVKALKRCAERDRHPELFVQTEEILTGETPLRQAIKLYEADGKLPAMVAENYPMFCCGDLDAMAQAADFISAGDLVEDVRRSNVAFADVDEVGGFFSLAAPGAIPRVRKRRTAAKKVARRIAIGFPAQYHKRSLTATREKAMQRVEGATCVTTGERSARVARGEMFRGIAPIVRALLNVNDFRGVAQRLKAYALGPGDVLEFSKLCIEKKKDLTAAQDRGLRAAWEETRVETRKIRARRVNI